MNGLLNVITMLLAYPTSIEFPWGSSKYHIRVIKSLHLMLHFAENIFSVLSIL